MTRALQSLVLWISQGFGTGRIRIGPGTWGSLVGLVWFALLLATGQLWLFIGGIIGGAVLSIWFCGAAENILKLKDPSSVVLDEIAAVPLCFLTWVLTLWGRSTSGPSSRRSFRGTDGWGRSLFSFSSASSTSSNPGRSDKASAWREDGA